MVVINFVEGDDGIVNGFYQSLSAITGKCFLEKSVRSRNLHLCTDASLLPVSLGVTRGPNYLSSSHPTPSWVRNKTNPDKMVDLTDCSMGEGCTQRRKIIFIYGLAY